ncbi:MAG: nucleotide exchange factor GrpE [Verrucomicrobia bacterium]|nr:nucleotide exchange factor GrpE [Verrucomicrobiota bacterium]
MNNDENKSVMTESDPSGSVGDAAESIVHVDLTPEQIDDLKEKAAKADEHWDRVLRVTADFDNYKKRAARERQEAIRFANESLLEKVVPVLDNFDMALQATAQPQASTVESLKTGVEMIYNQLKSVLIESGLEEINAANKPFDPNWHEAVSQQESRDVPEGQVVQQLRKGYKLRDRLLRPATVVVARRPAA